MIRITCVVLISFLPLIGSAQSVASRRAARIGKGMNLSWMDQRWKGTNEKEHRDYLDLTLLPSYKKQIELMYDMGYRFLRFPVCFDLWYDREEPYALLKPHYYSALDSIIKWTGDKNMMLSIDYHHGVLTSDQLEKETKRTCILWTDIARRYKHTDPERVFFELFNEPNQLSESEWESAAQKLIQVVRKEVPGHTLIVGAAKWNGLKSLLEMPLFNDQNILYTFHFYDPFLFTHQGASWAGDAASTIGMPYPYRMKDMPEMDEKAKATWAKNLYASYFEQANYEALYHSLESVALWSKKHQVPIFCGEWGAYKKYAPIQDRCQYLSDVYTILEQLKIPNAMWEWDAGFSFFNDRPSKNGVSDCLKKGLKLEISGK